MLRIQQGRPVIVGLRSEAVRIDRPSGARPGEVVLSGVVEHVEYQGHESLVHLDTGARPAVVPELESARPGSARQRARAASRQGGTAGLGRLVQKAAARVSGQGRTAVLDRPAPRPETERPAGGSGDLVVRTGPDLRLRAGQHVPVLVDLAHLYVFDHTGRRICPAPEQAPHLEY